jgi:hypothetical protein
MAQIISHGSPSVNCDVPAESPEFPIDHVSEDDRAWWSARNVASQWWLDLLTDSVADGYDFDAEARDQDEIDYHFRSRPHDRPGDLDQPHYSGLGRSRGYIAEF